MFVAALWGAIGASALVVGAVIAYVSKPGRGAIAVIMALGAGLLIGSVSFELIDDALTNADVAPVGLLTLVGAAAFTFGDWVLARRGGGDRKDAGGAQKDGSPLAIVMGSVLDGIPESFVLGLTVLEGGLSVALFVGVVLSNLPEGLSSSAGLRVAKWPLARVLVMWAVVVAVSAISAGLGYAVLEPGERAAALVEAFAAGALLAMVSDSLLPEAFRTEGAFTGSLVAVGFAISLMLSAI
jgi:ZIP family zinc transporter